MKIEDVTSGTVTKASDKELYSLRLRFIQLWSKHFEGTRKTTVDKLKRKDLVRWYGVLVKELRHRKLSYSTKAIDRALFKKAMIGFDVPTLGDIVVVPDYVSVRDVVKSDTEKMDIMICEDENDRDEQLESQLSSVISKQTGKQCRFTYTLTKPPGSYIALFDKVLRAKVKTTHTKSTSPVKTPHRNSDKWSDGSVAEFKSLLPFLKSNDSILDVGCGTGRIATLLSKYGYDVVGVDNNEAVLEIAKQKELNVQKTDLEKEDLPFNDDEFDVVIGTHVVEQLENPKHLIEESRRVAKRQILFAIPIGKSQEPTCKQTYERLSSLRELFKSMTATAEWIKGSKSTALVAAKTTPPTAADNQPVEATPQNNSLSVAKKSSDIADDSVTIDKMNERPTLKETLNARHDTLEQKAAGLNKALRLMPVNKKSAEHIVYGIVCEPEVDDSQGDIISEAEIRKTAYRFMEEAQAFQVSHDGKEVDTHILESFIAPDDFVVNSLPVKKGSWVLAVRVLNKKTWDGIVEGDLTGYSISGEAEHREK